MNIEIASWVDRMARLVRHKEPLTPETKSDYTSMLSHEFSADIFTKESLVSCISGVGWWPPYDDLRQRLAQWRNDNSIVHVPRQTKPEKRPGYERADGESTIDYQRRREREALNGERPQPPTGPRSAPLHVEWDDPDGICERIIASKRLPQPWNERALELLRGLVTMHAPQHLELFDQ